MGGFDNNIDYMHPFELSLEIMCLLHFIGSMSSSKNIKTLVAFFIFSVRSLAVIRTAINNIYFTENILQ